MSMDNNYCIKTNLDNCAVVTKINLKSDIFVESVEMEDGLFYNYTHKFSTDGEKMKTKSCK